MLVASSNFLIPNATIIVELIAFLIVFGILAKYVVPPIGKAVAKRQDEIAESLKVIGESKEKMAEATASYAEAMAKAHEDARAALDQASKMGEEIRSEARTRAQAEYDRLISRASADIEAARNQAIRDLQRNAGELALSIAEKIIGDELDESRHHQLIAKAASAMETTV